MSILFSLAVDHLHTEVELYKEEIGPRDMEFSTPRCSRMTSPASPDQLGSYRCLFQGTTHFSTRNEGPEVLESLASILQSRKFNLI